MGFRQWLQESCHRYLQHCFWFIVQHPNNNSSFTIVIEDYHLFLLTLSARGPCLWGSVIMYCIVLQWLPNTPLQRKSFGIYETCLHKCLQIWTVLYYIILHYAQRRKIISTCLLACNSCCNIEYTSWCTFFWNHKHLFVFDHVIHRACAQCSVDGGNNLKVTSSHYATASMQIWMWYPV